MLSADPGAQVGQRVRPLPLRVGIVVLIGAVADGFGTSRQRQAGPQGPRVLQPKSGGVRRRVGGLVASDVETVRWAAVRNRACDKPAPPNRSRSRSARACSSNSRPVLVAPAALSMKNWPGTST